VYARLSSTLRYSYAFSYRTSSHYRFGPHFPFTPLHNWNKNGLLHEDEYVNKLLMKATAVVEKADKRQNIDIEMGGDDEVSIQ
jgi:hypothetical protein